MNGARSDRALVRARWVVTMDPARRVVRDGAVLIENGQITAVGPTSELAADGAVVTEFPRHALLPGLVNAHTHVAGCVFRGLTEDVPTGFYELALPMERFLSAEAIHALSLLGIAEVLLAGCTVIHDMFHHAAETARAAVELGVRAQVAHKVFDVDLTRIGVGRHDPLPREGPRRLEQNVRLYERWHDAGDGLVTVRFGAHAADTCSSQLLDAIRAEAEARGAGRHIHAAQTPAERDYMSEHYGCGSIEFLERQGFLGAQTVVAHILFASASEIGILADSGTPVAHCPVSVAKTGSFPLVREIYDSGVPLGWGTDWVTMDPWDAMRTGVLVSRVATADIGFLSAEAALWRSTMGSAHVLGLADRVGSLEPGKDADLILVDVDQPHLAPLHDPVSVLVYNASGRDVTDVMVRGRWLVRGRRLIGERSADELVASAQAVAEEVWSAGGLEPPGLLATARRQGA